MLLSQIVEEIIEYFFVFSLIWFSKWYFKYKIRFYKLVYNKIKRMNNQNPYYSEQNLNSQ
jgi:uncharacterized membrane protein YciS (DUF1049 family)